MVIRIKCDNCKEEFEYKTLALPTGDLKYWVCRSCKHKGGLIGNTNI